MAHDARRLYKALAARDPRFDGVFFVGVTSTGIYCRPICPAKEARREHLRFFAYAAAAERAGFRPCLRCRPEVAPWTPAWNGTSATVTRALRLIGEGALDDGDVDALAARLGVTSRQVRRLFDEHVGAPPVAVAQARRVHFARTLLVETSLPITDVAFAAGFSSLRRFNTAMRVTGGPDWVNQTAFAVEGVASANVTPRERRLMLQRLLEERFALKLTTKVTTVDMNVLVVERRDGTLGPKVKEWNGTCRNGTPTQDDDPAMPRCLSGYRPGGITLDGATMFSVAELLSLPQGRALLGGMVGDATVLKGRYTMDLDYQFPPPRPANPGTTPEFSGPALSTAIREQWGLRIQPGQAAFRLVVIESAQLPIEN